MGSEKSLYILGHNEIPRVYFLSDKPLEEDGNILFVCCVKVGLQV